MISSTRYKLFHVPPHAILALLRPRPRLLQLIQLTDAPDDAVVEQVYYSPEYRSITFVVTHPSFPEIEPHLLPERLSSALTVLHAIPAADIQQVLTHWEIQLFGEVGASRSDLSDYERGVFDACKTFGALLPEPLRKDAISA